MSQKKEGHVVNFISTISNDHVAVEFPTKREAFKEALALRKWRRENDQDDWDIAVTKAQQFVREGIGGEHARV